MKADLMSTVPSASRPARRWALGLLLPLGCLLLLGAGPVPVEQPAGKARLLEMKVHLAWLSDRLTYACPLQARYNGESLEVHGQVPSLRSRQRALELAQEQTHRPILDDVEIVPSLELPRRLASRPDLSSAARRLLDRRVSGRITDLRVWAEGDGQVTVCGGVRSLEEKLAISLALHELAGCRCICNRLTISPVAHQGRQVTQVTADGRYYIIRPEGPGSPSRKLPSLSPSLDEQKASLMLTQAAAEPPGGPDKAGSGLQPTAASRVVRDPLADSAGKGVPAAQDNPSGEKYLAPPRPLPSGFGDPIAVATAEKRLTQQVLPGPDSRPQVLPSPAPRPQPAPPVAVSTWRPTGRPERVWPPAHDVRPPSAGPPSAHLLQPTAQPTVTRTTSAKPVERAEGGVLAKAAPAPAPASSRVDGERLKQQIDQVCGRFAHYVHIQEQPDQRLLVRIEVPSDGLEKLLMGRILSIPEVGSSQVQLESVVRPAGTSPGPGR